MDALGQPNHGSNWICSYYVLFAKKGQCRAFGGQYLPALGLEWLLLWVVATFIFVRGYTVAIKSGMSSIGLTVPRLTGGTVCYLSEVIGAFLLVLGRGVGLYIAALGTIVLFAFLISGAWLLIIGIYEEPAKE